MLYFADTWFWVALINKREPGHAAANVLKKKIGDDIVTSQLVMIEFMAHCSCLGPYLRGICWKLVKELLTSPIKVVPHTEDIYARALDRYASVSDDKKWSLVDCASFEIMNDENISHVLTEDADRDAVATRVVEFLSRVESLPR
jgi:predicted nucleic acid-binding protein